MDFIKRLFFEHPKDDYEKLLSDLDQQIQTLEVHLAETRLSERNVSLNLLGASFVTYVGILVYVFAISPHPTFSHLLLVVTFPFG
jgi:hypothetical protein